MQRSVSFLLVGIFLLAKLFLAPPDNILIGHFFYYRKDFSMCFMDSHINLT